MTSWVDILDSYYFAACPSLYAICCHGDHMLPGLDDFVNVRLQLVLTVLSTRELDMTSAC